MQYRGANSVEDTVVLREATASDADAVDEICRSIDPEDYMPEAFPAWLGEERAFTLIAERMGRPVAVMHVRMVSARDAWGMGVRVHRGYQRRGIGRALTEYWPVEARRRFGAQRALAATHIDNTASQGMFLSCGFGIVAYPVRYRWERGLPVPAGGGSEPRRPDAEEVWRRWSASVYATGHGSILRGHDGHQWLVATPEDVARYLHEGRALVAGEDAFCLWSERVDDRGQTMCVIGAVDGTAPDVAALMHAVLMSRQWDRAEVDARRERRLLGVLDRLGLPRRAAWGEMVIIRKDL
jgi:N-acetylglutamate synthase-like GNAT family acetyltransferase